METRIFSKSIREAIFTEMKPVIVMHFSAPTVFGPITLTVERSHPQKARSEAGKKT